MPLPKTCEAFLVDPNGVLRGKWLVGDSERAIAKGIAFPFSLMGLDIWGREVHETGLHIDSGDRDAICLPVEGRHNAVPWADKGTTQCMLAMHHLDGSPFMGDPRNALVRQVSALAEQGLKAQVAIELEFYLIEDHEGPPTALSVARTDSGPDGQHMYALEELDRRGAFLEQVLRAAQVQDLPVSSCVSEASPGQFEVNLTHRDPVAAADDAILLRRLIKAVAASQGLRATFMAKPFSHLPGSGMHVHGSFWRDGASLFCAGEQGRLSLLHAVQGCLATTEQAQLGFLHTLNGFRRTQPGSYAPNALTWGRDNRSVAIRLPAASGDASRLEHRLAGADANPYIVTALTLGAMAKGVSAGQMPGPETAANAYTDPDSGPLDPSMQTAIDRFDQSAFVNATLGAELQRTFSHLKRAELDAFSGHISSLEHQTYL